MGLGPGLPQLNFQSHHSVANWPWASVFTYLSLSFPIHKTGPTVAPPLIGL